MCARVAVECGVPVAAVCLSVDQCVCKHTVHKEQQLAQNSLHRMPVLAAVPGAHCSVAGVCFSVQACRVVCIK